MNRLILLIAVAVLGCSKTADQLGPSDLPVDDPVTTRAFVHTTIGADEIADLRRNRDKITSLRINSCPLDESVFETINQLDLLESLNLASTEVSDEDLKRFTNLTRVKRVWLNFTPVSDSGLPTICHMPNVTELGLHGTRISDAGLKFLSSQTQIKKLHVGGNDITDAGVAYLANNPNLEWLAINHNPSITNDSILSIANLPNLKFLQIGNTAINENCLDVLLTMRELRIVDTSNLGFSEKSMQRLRDELPNYGRLDDFNWFAAVGWTIAAVFSMYILLRWQRLKRPASSLVGCLLKLPNRIPNKHKIIWMAAFILLALAIVVHSGSGHDAELVDYVTFGAGLPPNSKVVATKRDPTGQDSRSYLIFDTDAAGVASFARAYTGGTLDAMKRSRTELKGATSTGTWKDTVDGLPWDLALIEHGRFSRHAATNGFLSIDLDANRVYVFR